LKSSKLEPFASSDTDQPAVPRNFQEFVDNLQSVDTCAEDVSKILVTIGPAVLELPAELEAKLRPHIDKVIGIIRINSRQGKPEYFVKVVA